jgi:hypothetical protein
MFYYAEQVSCNFLSLTNERSTTSANTITWYINPVAKNVV